MTGPLPHTPASPQTCPGPSGPLGRPLAPTVNSGGHIDSIGQCKTIPLPWSKGGWLGKKFWPF